MSSAEQENTYMCISTVRFIFTYALRKTLWFTKNIISEKKGSAGLQYYYSSLPLLHGNVLLVPIFSIKNFCSIY